MKLSEMTEILREIGVSPIRSLGQNFLHDQNLARWIVDQGDLSAADHVVEIGPGLGALTGLALAKGARVLAIEKDGRLAGFLREKFRGKSLEVVHGDALEFDTRVLYTQPRVKLLGNLPYYIASQLLSRYVKYPSPISLWLFMLQKEIAKRLVAEPGTGDYGALSLHLQLRFRAKYLRTVPATVFLPRPEIDSALVRIVPRDPFELPLCDHRAFSSLVRLGFSQRRKQLRNLLRKEVPAWDEMAARLGLKPSVRAEEVSLQEWIALTNHVAPINVGQADPGPEEQLPVVDESDRFLKAASRTQVHANNLLHRAVHLLIFNAEGEVFLQRRSRLKDRHPLAWDSSAAGHLHAAEEYDDAARRELQEELGVETPLDRIAKLPASKKTDYEFIWLYRGTHKGELHPDRIEIEAGEFFPPKIVNGWIAARPNDFAPGFVESWRVWRKQGN